MKERNHSLNQLTFTEVINLMMQNKRFIISSVFIVSFITAILSLMMPKVYTASVILMPPSVQSEVSIINAFSESELPFGGLISKSEEEAMRLIAILKSRTVLEKIINQFNLIDFYKSKNIEKALESLSDHVSLEIKEEGTLSIRVSVSTGWFHYEENEKYARQLSANIANEFVNQLDIVNKRLQIEQASHQRKFIGERYEKNRIDLIEAEEKLKMFKEDHNIISVENQTKEAIESASALKNQILINEVQKGIITAKLKSDHPEVISIENELSELKNKLYEIEYGKKQRIANEDNLFPILSAMPQIDADLMRLSREVEIQNTLFIYLTQQYEDAKIQEARNTPTIQLLDPAIPPIEKSSPKRMLMVIIMGLITFLISSFYILMQENHYV